MKTCNQPRLFINLTINERVELLSNTLIDIFRNYIPEKKVNFKYGEVPWVNKNIKLYFIQKIQAYKKILCKWSSAK